MISSVSNGINTQYWSGMELVYFSKWDDYYK